MPDLISKLIPYLLPAAACLGLAALLGLGLYEKIAADRAQRAAESQRRPCAAQDVRTAPCTPTAAAQPDPRPRLDLQPGDRVIITQTCWGHVDDVYFWLEATPGSIARVINMAEYRQRYQEMFDPEPPERVEKWMQAGVRVPVIFESVVEPGAEEDDDYDSNNCVVGGVTVLDGRFIRRIESASA